MKTKFKDFLLYSLACVGAVSLLMSVSANLSNKQQKEAGTYQMAVFGKDGKGIHILNTTTGNIKSVEWGLDIETGVELYFTSRMPLSFGTIL